MSHVRLNVICLILASSLCLSWKEHEPLPLQEQLDQALQTAFQHGPETLTSFVASVEEDPYWRAFGLFYLGVYYQYRDEKDEAFAKMYCEEAQTLLESKNHKDSEDLALLSYISGYMLQWYKGPTQWVKAKKTKTWAKQALALDPANPRACFVYGNLDSYTPKSLGGGKMAYALLKDALQKLEKEIPEAGDPSWGLLKTYQALTRHCLNTGRVEEAKDFLDKGLSLYPTDQELTERRAALIY